MNAFVLSSFLRSIAPIAALLLATASSAVVPTFRKTTLDDRFLAEGASFGDINRDGQLDAIAGSYWYAGPEFKERHEIYATKPFDPLQYSDNFFTYTYDFNADGWTDVFVIGFPGSEAVWYQNPGVTADPWIRHAAFQPVENESPHFGHLFPDQPPVLVCVSQGRFGYARFDPADPKAAWAFHAITPPGPWQRFTHGLGFGDVNGDGRNDLLEAGGWWEQPASLDGNPVWQQHAFAFAPGRGSAQMYAFDVNGDGLNDVVTSRDAHGYGLSWFEHFKQADGSIGFREHAITSTKADERLGNVQFSQLHSLVVADVDRDGLPDLVTGKRWWAHGPKGDVDPMGTPVIYAFLMRRGEDRSVQFEPVMIDDASGIGTQFETADVNADGYPDFVTANKRGSFLFLSSINGQSGDAPDAKLNPAETQRSSFHLPPGFEIQLVASEPNIGKPLNLNFDARGRAWVTTSRAYPWPAKRDALGEPIAIFKRNWDSNQLAFRAATTPPAPVENGPDQLYVLSDFGPDGRARRSTLFADGLNIPVGVMPLPRAPGSRGDSVVAFSIPTIWRFTDSDGDGVADRRERLYSEFGFKDTHGMSSNYTYWVDGWIYGTHGFANHSEIRDGAGRLTILDSGNTYRFRPDGSRFEQWAWGQTNPFGLAFDQRGDVYTADSHSKPVYLIQPGGYYEGISKKHDGLGFAPSITLDDHGSSAIAGIANYAATQFPPEFRGNLFNGNPVTGRVNRDRLEWQGSTPRAIRMPDFLSSDDPSFRPVQVKLGPDGALWIVDFYNPIIGHYEVPLTHPSRDRSHGRIWRVIWRGLKNEVGPPELPNLADAGVEQLITRLSDPNLTVRNLAANELVDRVGLAAAPQLKAMAASVFAQPDTLAALPLANVMERLGISDDTLLFKTLAYAGDETGGSALRILANRTSLGEYGEVYFRELITRTKPGFVWRSAAEVFARHPAPWQGRLIMEMMPLIPEKDHQLLYGLRLALKAVIGSASVAQLMSWESAGPSAGDFLSNACLAVPLPLVGEYLLGYLERTRFASKNAGELARHAVQHLPPERYDAISPLVKSLEGAPMTQQLALAEGLALAAKRAAEPLPTVVDSWMQQTLITAAGLEDPTLARRAVEAAEPIVFPAMLPVLRQMAVDLKIQQYPLRFIAVRALPPSLENRTIFEQVLGDGTASSMLRKLAVDALGNPKSGPDAVGALAMAMPTASSDVALAIAIVLAKTDTGAGRLIAEVSSGRVPARLLTHGYVAPALAERPAALQAQVMQLTRELPPENARLDAVIAARTMAYGRARPNLVRGGAIFAEQCASCHKLRDTGGSLGPSLDGLASRGVTRIMEDILDPSRAIDPMFRLTTVTDPQGGTQSGMNLQDLGETYRLTDLTGQLVTLPKHQVAKISPMETSLMPGGFETTLTADDFFSLINFLVTKPAR